MKQNRDTTVSNDLLVPLSVLALEVDATAAQLADRFADQTLVDSIGRICLDHDSARQVIGEHRARLAAAEQAKREAAEQQAAQDQRRAEQQRAEAAARAAREAKQAEILRANPDLSALELMLATDVDPDRNTPAGRRFDDLIAAERAGQFGVMYTFPHLKED